MDQRITIEKLVAGGQGMGRFNDKVAFIWGALPGEEVLFRTVKSKKQFIEGVVTEVLTPSPVRQAPRDEHYLTCSPWQTMSFDDENRWKVTVAQETYQRLGGITAPADLSMHTGEREYGYRNKLEFSFTTDYEGNISLAFHERGSLWRAVAAPGCALGSPVINETAHLIVAWLHSQDITSKQLKSIVVRSNEKGETIAALFIKDTINWSSYPTLSEKFLGFHIYFSNPLSPASVPTELVYSEGLNYLTESVCGTALRYGLLSFFQVNVPVFEKTVEDIKSFIEDESVVFDYYSGVGSISLPLAKKCKQLKLVENNKEAVMYAEENIKINKINNAQITLVAAEQDTEAITADSIVILDPPRTGLHKQMAAALLAAQPRRIIYVSCDLATQARDMATLETIYKPVFWRLYNFFPRTPHTEGLVVLEKRVV